MSRRRDVEVKRGRETLQLYTLKPAEYFRLAAGNEIYDEHGARYKVTSVQKWAKRPNDMTIQIKHGMYDFGSIYIRDGQPAYPWTNIYRQGRQEFKAPKGLQGFPAKVGDKLITKEPIIFGQSRVEEGSVGELTGVHLLTPEQSTLYHGGQRALLTVKFQKGGTFFNVYPRQVKVKKPRLSR
jgi:hypothetical protein